MQRRLAHLLCLFLPVAFAAAQPYLSSRIVSVRATETGSIEAIIRTEKSGEFDAITPENQPVFTIRENGIEKKGVRGEALPGNDQVSRTVMLADLSRSLTRRQFADYKRAATDFVDRLKAGDLVALVTFHRKVVRELDFTGDRELLKRRIRNLKQTGRRTMLYDALVEAHKMLRGEAPRKAILVYTDGRENASRVTFPDLTEIYTAQPVPLFVAGNRKSWGLKKLIRLARVSGGDAFRAEDRHDLAKVFHYLSRLRAQEFRVSYKTDQKPGSTIDLEIKAQQWAQPLIASYTIPQTSYAPPGATEKLFAVNLPAAIRTHMPEILLSLIVLLLIAVIIILFFRRQEISVKVENMQPPGSMVVPDEFFPLPGKKAESSRAKLPLDYYHAWLVEKEGPHTGRKYRINWHSITLGYTDDNSIVIDDNTVSPRHARIERQGKKFVLFDLMSENGTWLNGKKLLRPKELNDFDEIGLGRTRLIFRKSAGLNDKTQDSIE